MMPYRRAGADGKGGHEIANEIGASPGLFRSRFAQRRNEADLDAGVEGKHVGADGNARVLTVLAENLVDQLGGAVGHLRLLDEVVGAMNIDKELDDALDVVQRADHLAQRGQGIETGGAGGGASLFDGHRQAQFSRALQMAVRKGELAGGIGQVAGFQSGNIGSHRLGNRGKNNAVFGNALFGCVHSRRASLAETMCRGADRDGGETRPSGDLVLPAGENHGAVIHETPRRRPPAMPSSRAEGNLAAPARRKQINKRMKRRQFQVQNAHPEPPRQETELEGELASFTYESEDGQYCVVRLHLANEEKPVVIVGALSGLKPGERVQVKGAWKVHPRYGNQFVVESYIPLLPATSAALETYLSSGLFKGIGEKIAHRIVSAFGEDTLDILEHAPERLREIKGLSRKAAKVLSETWDQHRQVRDIMIFLQGVGISPSLATRLYRHYGNDTARILRENPYQVALEVRQIGFRTADQLAEKLGVARDAPERAEAGIVHVLTDALGDGHTFLPREELLRQSGELLQLDEALVAEALERLSRRNRVARHTLPEGQEAVFAPALYTCEATAAQVLHHRVEHMEPRAPVQVDEEIAAYERTHEIELAPEQREAIRCACGGGCLVVTGGPGTGKTTLIRAVIHLLDNESTQILLCAPTGRAAQRLSEATGRSAATIHRLLKYSPETGFFHNPKNPLPADLLIVDETSMVDIPLAYHLLRALRPSAAVMFVGDVDQLPSVGPGNFLRDLIGSEVLPVVRLYKIFRQSQRSLIVVNAHRINEGQYPIVPRNEEQKPNQDFFFVEREDPAECLRLIKLFVKDRIPNRFRLHPVDDIQVLTPMRKGMLGVQNLNTELQALLNPAKGGYQRGGTLFKVGDKVMQQVNNYDLDVFNGDLGIIVSIDAETHEVNVKYGHRIVRYNPNALDEIALAYACTIHKSQGSEYKAVVMPIHTQHFILLQRNLLYTGVTRGKKLVCLIGSRRAMWIAIQNDQIRERHSALRQWLQHGLPSTERIPGLDMEDLLPFD